MFVRMFKRLQLYILTTVVVFPIVMFIWSSCICSCIKDSCGYIVSTDKKSIKNAVLENVVLYSQKSDSSPQKIARNGVLLKRADAKGTILICHGFTCSKNDIGFLRYIFPDYNCMTFDFRAHGENADGQVCSLGKHEAYDVMSAAKFLRNHPDLQEKPLVGYGFSMGAVAAIEAQSKDASLFDGMILDCPFSSAEDVIKKGLDNKKFSIFGYEFRVPGKSILSKYAFHPYIQSFVKAVLKVIAGIGSSKIKTFICPVYPAESIKNVFVPCLFVYCKNDEKISIDAIKSVYYNAASPYKKLWITNGRKHFDSFFYNPEKYAERLKKFADKIASGTLQKKQKHKVVEDRDGEMSLTYLQGNRISLGCLDVGLFDFVIKRGICG